MSANIGVAFVVCAIRARYLTFLGMKYINIDDNKSFNF